MIYLRDEESGELWSPTPAPIRLEQAHYSCTHGFGYTRFQQRSHGLALELTLLVAGDDPVKLCRLRIRNDSGRQRNLSVTAYVEWVLSPARVHSAPHIITEADATTGALLARNPWNHAFPGVAFADLGGRQTEWTCDRREFLGRHGALEAPAALVAGTTFSGRTGAALDPCCALRGHVELAPGASTDFVMLLGQAESVAAVRELVTRLRTANVDELLNAVDAQWRSLTDHVQVTTPDRAFDVMMNGWLLYQTLACRTWARAAFYQASGAYGFRDQLQDAMALAVARPQLLREQILRAARPAIPRGRRAALVAAAQRPGCAHAHFR